MKKKTVTITGFAIFGLPGVVFAAPGNFTDLMNMIVDLVQATIPVIIMLALAVFFFGLVKLLTAADDASKRKEGNAFIVWGLMSLFVIIGIWGVLTVIHATFFSGSIGEAVDSNIPKQIYGNISN